MDMSQRSLRSALLMFVTIGALSLGTGTIVSAQTVIGAAAPMTGPRALLGRNFKQGVELALEEINAAGGVLGKPFSVVFEDDQGDNPNAGINAVNKLIQVHKVPLMMGPHYTINQMATQKSFCEKGPVSLTGASGVPVTAGGCKFVIRVRASDSIQAKALIDFARRELKVDKIGVLYINDDFGKAGSDRVIKSMEDLGLKPVAVESHNSGDKDFSAQLSKFKNANASAVILWTHDTEAALIVRQARQLGLNFAFAGSTSLSEPSFLKLAGDASEAVMAANDFVPTNPDPRTQAFVKKYQAKYNMLPEIWAATYYDATYLAAKAIQAAGSADPDKVRAAFSTLQYTGVLASFKCEANGDCNHQILIVEDKGGQPVVRSTVKF